MTTLTLSSSFKKKIISTFGHTGQTWLANLPALIIYCETRFNIKIGTAFDHQSFNFTAVAIQADGTEIVIKICVPTSEVDVACNLATAFLLNYSEFPNSCPRTDFSLLKGIFKVLIDSMNFDSK